MRRMTNPNPRWGKNAGKPLLPGVGRGSPGRDGGPPLPAGMGGCRGHRRGRGSPRHRGNPGRRGREGRPGPCPAGGGRGGSLPAGCGARSYPPQRQGRFSSDKTLKFKGWPGAASPPKGPSPPGRGPGHPPKPLPSSPRPRPAVLTRGTGRSGSSSGPRPAA